MSNRRQRSSSSVIVREVVTPIAGRSLRHAQWNADQLVLPPTPLNGKGRAIAIREEDEEEEQDSSGSRRRFAGGEQGCPV